VSNKHALIIEDDQSSAEVLEFLLSTLGVGYTIVYYPTQVSDVVNNLDKDIDVVFLDLEMPGLDGYDVHRILTEDLGVKAPIVACTVHTSQIDIARSLGFHSFIGKPLIADHFPNQLSRILQNEPVWELP
jgi:CheY-like chemotaxis protein